MAQPNLAVTPLPNLNTGGVPMAMNMDGSGNMNQQMPMYLQVSQSKLDIFSLTNYTFSMKDAQPDRDNSQKARIQRLKDRYQKEGMRRSVDAVLVVHQHGHPHVLLIQIANNYFRLPGGRCREGEDEISCLKRKLCKKLSPPNQYSQPNWEIGEILGTYWRPNFEQHMYPYLPPHITKPKECRKLLLFHCQKSASSQYHAISSCWQCLYLSSMITKSATGPLWLLSPRPFPA
jgi:cleavage and polyadenylation specificity factor subunit 5